MAELRIDRLVVTAVLASSEACDRLEPAGATLLRTAPRESLLVGLADLDAIRDAVDEPTALVEDVSDAWTACVLTGEGTDAAFARVSELEPPAEGAWIQGEVAHVAAKVIGEPHGLTVLVPANLAAHVEERLRIDAAEVLT